jgi:hypothetical protein
VIRRFFRYLFVYRWIPQGKACGSLKKVMADAKPPKQTYPGQSYPALSVSRKKVRST